MTTRLDSLESAKTEPERWELPPDAIEDVRELHRRTKAGTTRVSRNALARSLHRDLSPPVTYKTVAVRISELWAELDAEASS